MTYAVMDQNKNDAIICPMSCRVHSFGLAWDFPTDDVICLKSSKSCLWLKIVCEVAAGFKRFFYSKNTATISFFLSV